LPVLIRKLKLEEADYLLSDIEQEILVRKKLAYISLESLDNQFKTDVEDNVLLQQLRSSLENENTFLQSYAESHGTDPNRRDTISRYKTVYYELLRDQRAMLEKINKKAEFNDEIIRKLFSQLDLAEERLRLQFKG
jgi:CPA1 family monovalent cation:H+ antiporter